MASHLIIFGVSTRAAAFSALRAGLSPWCVDLFADADLMRVCPVVQVRGRQAVPELSKRAPPGPWMFAGGLENHPLIVDRTARGRLLWGNDGAVLRRIRSPFALAEHLQEVGLPCPRVCRSPDQLAGAGRWLIKPLASGGGSRIAAWPQPLPGADLKRCYFQEFIEGEACAAIFAGLAERVELLGVTRQLVGRADLHAKPFAYCGSIGPWPLSQSLRAALTTLGEVLWSSFGLRGLFGVDFMLRDDVPWPVEVNPRYTASVEIVELGCGLSAMRRHQRAFVPESPPTKDIDWPPTCQAVGKGILFAPDDLVFPENGPWLETLNRPIDCFAIPAFADIPHPGQRIARGRPILTVVVQADSVADCEQRLAAAAGETYSSIVR